MWVMDYKDNSRIDSVIEMAQVGQRTQMHIAIQMVDLIPDEWFEPKKDELISSNKLSLVRYAKSHKVLNVQCKSGILLYCFYARFFRVLSGYDNFRSAEDIQCYITKNLLYGVCANRGISRQVRGKLYNNISVSGNIYTDGVDVKIENNIVMMKKRGHYKPISFGIVCGDIIFLNAFNRSMDIALQGHEIAKDYDLWFMPAQIVGGYRDESLVDYMKCFSEFIYYPESIEVAKSRELTGLCICLADKSAHDKVGVVNKCKIQPLLSSERVFRDIRQINTLSNVGASIIKKLNVSESYRLPSVECKYCVRVFASFGYSGYTKVGTVFSRQGDMRVLNRRIIVESGTKVRNDTAFKVIFSSDDYSECENFVSYLYSKFTRFLIYCGLCEKSTIMNTVLRFVPNITDLSMVYEDKPLEGYLPDENGEYTDDKGIRHCSLYNKFKLTDSEINVIESVVREYNGD